MTNIDAIDRELISILATNARIPVAQIATRLKLARTTIQARIERLERNNVIEGYTIRLSDAAERVRIRATVLIRITPAAQAAVLAQLMRLVVVERVVTTAGRFDLACDLACTDTTSLDETLDKIGAIDGVQALESLIHLSTRFDRRV